jgi:hypothetical protein
MSKQVQHCKYSLLTQRPLTMTTWCSLHKCWSKYRVSIIEYKYCTDRHRPSSTSTSTSTGLHAIPVLQSKSLQVYITKFCSSFLAMVTSKWNIPYNLAWRICTIVMDNSLQSKRLEELRIYLQKFWDEIYNYIHVHHHPNIWAFNRKEKLS